MLQSTILLSFWGGAPNAYWNFYAWISTGVTIAETLGLHRSLQNANLNNDDRKLLRRLWWVLVIRDASSSALVGRPFRINVGQADTELLSSADFEHERTDAHQSPNLSDRIAGLYQAEMVKISLILRELVSAGFLQNKPEIPFDAIMNKLQAWRQGLPTELQWSTKEGASAPLAATLLASFHHVQILAWIGQARCQRLDVAGSTDPLVLNSCRTNMAHAAQQISNLATSMLHTWIG